MPKPSIGEMVWRYQSYQGDLLCLEYILRFDPAGMLRQWTRQGCQAAEPERLSFFSRGPSVVGPRDAQPPAG